MLTQLLVIIYAYWISKIYASLQYYKIYIYYYTEH